MSVLPERCWSNHDEASLWQDSVVNLDRIARVWEQVPAQGEVEGVAYFRLDGETFATVDYSPQRLMAMVQEPAPGLTTAVLEAALVLLDQRRGVGVEG